MDADRPIHTAAEREMPPPNAPLRHEPSGWLGGLVSLVLVSWLGALAFGVPDLAAIGLAPAVLLIYGLMTARSGPLSVTLSLDRDQAIEGDCVHVQVQMKADRYWRRVVCEIELTPSLQPDPLPARVALRPGRGGTASASVTLLCRRWGEHQVGPVLVLAYSKVPLFVGKSVVSSTESLRVRPAPLALRLGITAAKTQAYVGNQLARERGQGMEFADMRRYLPGDPVRSINWRVTAREGKTHVNLHHPDRNSDVVIFVDTFADLGPAAAGSLALAGRAAATLAEYHLTRRRDRVGLLLYGGVLEWLAPSSGIGQLHRILDTIVDSRVTSSYARPTLAMLPPQLRSRQSLVIAISPLVDPRAVHALMEIKAGQSDLALLEIDPELFVEVDSSRHSQVARRVWGLWRAARRAELLAAGIPVVRWDPTTPIDQPIFAVNQLRRQRWTAGV